MKRLFVLFFGLIFLCSCSKAPAEYKYDLYEGGLFSGKSDVF